MSTATTSLRSIALVGSSGIALATHYARIIQDEAEHRFCGAMRADMIVLSLQSLNPGKAPEDTRVTTKNGFWEEALSSVARLGAEAVVLCSHCGCDFIEVDCSSIKVLPIDVPLAAAIRQARLPRVGFLGAHESRAENFWRDVLNKEALCDVLFPVARDRDYLAELGKCEFSRGLVTPSAKADLVRIAHSLKQAGARALVILSPEFTAILDESVPMLPIFDAAELHALSAVDWMSGRHPINRIESQKREREMKSPGNGSAQL